MGAYHRRECQTSSLQKGTYLAERGVRGRGIMGSGGSNPPIVIPALYLGRIGTVGCQLWKYTISRSFVLVGRDFVAPPARRVIALIEFRSVPSVLLRAAVPRLFQAFMSERSLLTRRHSFPSALWAEAGARGLRFASSRHERIKNRSVCYLQETHAQRRQR